MRRAVLLVGVCLPLCLWAMLPLASRAAGPEARAGALPDRIAAREQRIAAKRARERILTTTVDAYNRRVRLLQSKVETLDRRLRPLQADLAAESRRLDATQRRLRFQRARAQRLRERMVTARRVLAARLIAQYESDRPDLVTVVLNSDGFAELLERAAFVRRIVQNDREIIGAVRRAKTRRAGGQCGSRIAREWPATLGRRAGRQAHADRRGPPRRRDEPKRAVPRP